MDLSNIPALSVWIMEVDKFIQYNHVQQVSSHAIHEPSSNTFAPTGLFSEQIFGQVGSNERLITFGYMELNTTVFHPLIYKNICKLSAFYEEIMSGISFGRYDEEKRDFERCGELAPGAGTGFSFFLSYFDQIDFTETSSLTRSDRIDLLHKYKDRAFITKMIVEPAGLRDLETDAGMLSQDDINKLYLSLLSLTLAIPSGAIASIFDPIRIGIQKKIVEIYNYLENINTGKKGFIQGAWGQRRVAFGTRNVITGASFNTDRPDSPQALLPDEVMLGILQAMKSIQPAVVNVIRTAIIEPVFSQNSNIIPLINKETISIEYREIDAKELARFDSDTSIEAMINRFGNINLSYKPITVNDIEGGSYYLCMLYDTGDEISLFRGLQDFRNVSDVEDFNMDYVRPMTWADMFYITTFNVTQGKHAFITRYPVLGDGSVFPSRVHLVSTNPSRVVHLRDAITGVLTKTYPEYPIIGEKLIGSLILHTARLPGIGGDYDKPYNCRSKIAE